MASVSFDEGDVILQLNFHLELIKNQFAALFIAGDPIATKIYQMDSVQTIEDAKLIHYGRNLLLDPSILSFDDIVLNGTYLPAPDSQNAFHRNGVGNGENTKWLSANGFHEFVIREIAGGFEIVTEAENVGTYNFASKSLPTEDYNALHFAIDIIPWLVLGNSESDSTTEAERESLFLGSVAPFIDDAFAGYIENVTGIVNAESHGSLDDDNLSGTFSGIYPFISANNDALYGLAGNDTLTGGAGADYLEGGDGLDTASYLGSGNGVVVDIRPYPALVDFGGGSLIYLPSAGRGFLGDASADSQPDILADIENIFGSDHSDIIVGNYAANQLWGFNGPDAIYGQQGDDTLRGGNGADRLYGEGDADSLYGNGDADTLYGGTGNDTLYGGADNDLLKGEADIDQLFGEAGNDQVYGDEGNDTLYGGTGTDTLYGGADNDLLKGEADNDQLFGEGGNDELYGDDGNDTLFGGIGYDKLNGGVGNDTLDGGLDYDTAFYQKSFSGNYSITRNVDNSYTITSLSSTEGQDTLIRIETVTFGNITKPIDDWLPVDPDPNPTPLPAPDPVDPTPEEPEPPVGEIPLGSSNSLLAVTAVSTSITVGQSISLSKLFPENKWVDNDGGYDIQWFAVQDRTLGGGYLTYNGVKLAENVVYEYPTAELSKFKFVAASGLALDIIGFNIIQGDGDFSPNLDASTIPLLPSYVATLIPDNPLPPEPDPDPTPTNIEARLDLDSDVASLLLEDDERPEFTIERRDNLEGDIVVEWRVFGIGDNPTDDRDFTVTSGFVTLRDGESEQGFSINFNRDQVDEADETFKIDLDVVSGNARFTDDDATFTILDDDEPGIDPNTDDHGNSFGTATEVAEDRWARGYIEQTGDYDYFKFNLKAGVDYEIIVIEDSDLSLIGGDPDASYPRLLDPVGLLYNQNFQQMASLTPTSTTRMTYRFEPAQDGMYYLRVNENGNNDIGQYFVKADIRTPADDYAGNISTTAFLTLGDPLIAWHERDFDDDWFSIALEADKSYRFAVIDDQRLFLDDPNALNGVYYFGWSNPTLSIRDASGTQVYARSIVGFESHNLLEFTPSVDGQYFLQVYDNTGNLNLGKYYVLAEEVEEQPDTQHIVLQPSGEDVDDIRFSNIRNEANSGVDDELLTANKDTSSAIKFDLANLPSTVTYAAIEVFLHSTSSLTGLVGDLVVDVPTYSWSESSTFSDILGVEYLLAIPALAIGEWVTIPITDLYNQWQAGEILNNGILLATTEISGYTLNFYSSDYNENPSLRPRLVIYGPDAESEITGMFTASMLEDDLPATGAIAISSPVDPNASFANASFVGDFGSIQVNDTGDSWTYTLDGRAQRLANAEVQQDTLIVTASNGASQQFQITVEGLDDPSVILGRTLIEFPEAAIETSGVFAAADIDRVGDVLFVSASMIGDFGAFQIDSYGAWSYQLSNMGLVTISEGDVETDSFEIQTDDGTIVTLDIKISGNDLNLLDITQANPAIEDLTLNADALAIVEEHNPASITYQWLRDGQPIEDETGQSLRLTQSDVGSQISVRYGYNDLAGAERSVTTLQTPPVQNVNDVPVGTVVITGNSYVGQTLIADLSSIVDEDGFDIASVQYQWFLNGNPLGSQTGESLLATQSISGAFITVSVSYVDAYGNAEAVLSLPRVISNTPAQIGTSDPELLVGDIGVDTISGGGGNDTVQGMGGDDFLAGGMGADSLVGGEGNDTFHFASASWGVDQIEDFTSGYDCVEFGRAGFSSDLPLGTLQGLSLALGTSATVGYAQFIYDQASGDLAFDPDGTGSEAAIQFASLVPGTALVARDIKIVEGDPALLTGHDTEFTQEEIDTLPIDDFMRKIKDYDGNNFGAVESWFKQGEVDIQNDGDLEIIFTNRALGRWASLGPDESGIIDFDNHGQGGDTRVLGIYIDPLVVSGAVAAGSDHDSQRRFQNDLFIDNLRLLGGDDFDADGFQELYFKIVDGTAYLRAIMHADGNIQYANYQNEQQMTDYLIGQGYTEEYWGQWLI